MRLDDGRSVGFDVKDYAHIDHGYAATVHKSQGVTVDRTHVLATSHMDRHAAYVGLCRHRERVDLHWGADELGSRERLTRALGRERLKDTSLDYGFGRTEAEPEIRRESAANSARAYAERRGLVPESEIVLRERPAETQRAEPARPRRGMFAGLKLDAGRPEPVPAPAVAPATTEQEREADRLAQSVGAYARAWADTARMRQAGLPVLPHQAAALADADRALDAQLPRFGQDLDAALTQAPRLAQGAGTDHGIGGADRGRADGARRAGEAGGAGARDGAGLGQAGAGVRPGRRAIRPPDAAGDRRGDGAVRPRAEAGSPARQRAAPAWPGAWHRRGVAADAGGAEPEARLRADARAGAAAHGLGMGM